MSDSRASITIAFIVIFLIMGAGCTGTAVQNPGSPSDAAVLSSTYATTTSPTIADSTCRIS
jgi:hypothetical protein